VRLRRLGLQRHTVGSSVEKGDGDSGAELAFEEDAGEAEESEREMETAGAKLAEAFGVDASEFEEIVLSRGNVTYWSSEESSFPLQEEVEACLR
jgi:hypothetical protein